MRLLGVLEMVVVTAIWGSVSILAIWSGLPSPVFVFFRVFIAFLILLAFLREFDAKSFLRISVFLSGIFLALNWIALFYAVLLVPVAEAVMLYYTGPLLAVVIMHFLGERAGLARLGLAAAAFIGAVAVIKPFNISGSAGALIALVSGVLYGLLIVTNKLAVRSLPPIRLVFYQTAIATAATAPFLFTTEFRLTPSGLAAALTAALVNTLLALYLWYDALKKISVHLASVLSYLDPVFATAFAYFLLGQAPSATALLGGTLVITSGVLSALLEARKKGNLT